MHSALSPDLERWTAEHLGSRPREVLFTKQQISEVRGLLLQDGREVVVKIRPPAERIAACFFVQRYVWQRGFPCPEPLAGPALLGSGLATAEAYVSGGDPLDGDDVAPSYAKTLATLVGLVPANVVTTALEPPPYWMNWDHELTETWSPDPNVDLNSRRGPDWLERAGELARERIRRASSLPDAIGHGDWESQNLRWRGRDLYVAHDWDSVVRRPEALIAGMTSLIFPSSSTRPNQPASLEASEAFLEMYQATRGRRFTRDEMELAWAAGLWLGAWKAKKALFYEGAGPVLDDFEPQVEERIRWMGL